MSTIYEFKTGVFGNYRIEQDNGAVLRTIAGTPERVIYAKKLLKWEAYTSLLIWLVQVTNSQVWLDEGENDHASICLHLVVGDNQMFSIDRIRSRYTLDGVSSRFDEDRFEQPTHEQIASWITYYEIGDMYFAFEKTPILPMVREELWAVRLPDGVQAHNHRWGLPQYNPHDQGELDHNPDEIITLRDVYTMLMETDADIWVEKPTDSLADMKSKTAKRVELYKITNDFGLPRIYHEWLQYRLDEDAPFPRFPEMSANEFYDVLLKAENIWNFNHVDDDAEILRMVRRQKELFDIALDIGEEDMYHAFEEFNMVGGFSIPIRPIS